MAGFDYESLLDRARDNIPQDLSSSARWKLPEPDVLIEGSQTIIRNFSDIVDMMDRDANHVYHFMQNELGTSGSREERRVLLKGRIPPKRIKQKLGNCLLYTSPSPRDRG